MTEKIPKVLIGLPTMGSIHILTSITLMAWLVDSMREGDLALSVYPTMSVQPVDNARNEIVREFLRGDATHLLFIDADTIPPPDALKRLLAHKKPIVSAITPIIELDENRNPWKKSNCVGLDDKHVESQKGLVPIKGAGSSCILIERSVFEQMPDPWYRFRYEDDNGKKTFKGEPLIISEDIHFILQALSRGIEVYADTDIVCGHNKSIIF